jgi:YidC/Oxa1 family membrane protein insertase
MWLQMKLNPMPTDLMQATIFNWMPWVFMFVMGGFASGLLLYWIAQQRDHLHRSNISIMRLNGSRPDLFGNIKASVSIKKGGAAK